MRFLSAITLSLAVTSANAAPDFTARTPDLETYLSMVAATEADLNEMCAALATKAPPAGHAWLRIGANGLELAPDEARSAEAAAFWAELALGARQAARSLYGRAAAETFLAGPVLIELGPNAASIFDGETRTSGGLCDAMTRLVGAMGDAPANPFAAARAAVAASAAPVAIGGETEITFDAPLSPDASLRGPDGLTATLSPDGSGMIVTASADAIVGDSAIRIYAPDDVFRPIDEIPVTILPGADQPLPPRQIGAIAPGGAFSGDLPLGGSVELEMTLKDARNLTLAAASDADLRVEVLTKGGEQVAADDDSGGGYGFSVNASLSAGAYVVKVTHCCGGGGAFVISATSE